MEKLVLLGAGGHCKVVTDLLDGLYEIIGITDIDTEKHNRTFYGLTVIGNDDLLRYIYCKGVKNALVTLGSVSETSARRRLFELASGIGFTMVNVVSARCIISKTIRLGMGNVVMDSAVIHADTVIGNNTIINTGAIIEHDCVIGDHAHVSPGVRLAGGVQIGEGTHIGIGAAVIQGIKIGKNCTIGAGSVVIADVEDNSVCVGIPARKIKSRQVNV